MVEGSFLVISPLTSMRAGIPFSSGNSSTSARYLTASTSFSSMSSSRTPPCSRATSLACTQISCKSLSHWAAFSSVSRCNCAISAGERPTGISLRSGSAGAGPAQKATEGANAGKAKATQKGIF
ncbi:hypothetical protein NitaMp149 (mitochondrion) [Nicotiana tabacum]|uniref:Uncharacterized protein n=1 Tax=Nicotiana tabacum TaxID=4097 RepID=Q5M9S6_TOBAC|nr:hypothetical protein NitaMp149 [Nicotiana tabacum]BAD83552.1 hypothetical protein [Nicotiana tabacum]